MPKSITTASILGTAMLVAACASGPGQGATIDLGSGPPRAGNVTPTELYERPESLFVAQFLGESSIFCGIVSGERQVDVNGHRLTAGRGEQPDGTPVAVVVRPERIRIEPDGPRPGSNNAVPGRILQHIYFGNSRKVEVRLDDGATVLVRESAGALSPGNADDRVWLTFEPDNAAILATGGHPQVATPPEPTTAGSR